MTVYSQHPMFVTKVAVAEYRTGYLYSDSNFYSFYNGAFIKFNFGGRKIVDVTTGFNLLLALDDEGSVWTSRLTDAHMGRIETDTSGEPFKGNKAIYGYANTHTSIRSDGSLWYWGDDTLHLFHQNGRVTMRPTRLSLPGMKIEKAAMGLLRILALTTDGQVWEWDRGRGVKPTRKRLPGPAVNIFVSQWDYAGCLIPDPGGPGGTGYPYVWGTDYGFWGGTGPYAEPTSIRALWKLKVPIREIEANFNTTHYIDVQGRLFGVGDNVMGEIGNGQELVNQHSYRTRYGWSFTKDEYLTHGPPVQVGVGIKWKKLFSNNFLAFYKYALDEHDSLYFWGRDKAMASGRGLLNLEDGTYPNAMDVLVPTMVHPIGARFRAVHFTLPTISAGEDQSVAGNTTTLKGTATPPQFKTAARTTAAMDPLGYRIVGWRWTKLKGPACTIMSPDSSGTVVKGLVPGLYVFNLKTLDSNAGTQSADVTVKVTR